MTSAPASRSASAPSSRDSPPRAPRYRVFLSYSHVDTIWARWLLRRLETYRVPARFHGRAAPIGEVGARIVPVFRDRDELPTSSDLGEVVRAALRESATLVVICSPASARSRWVHEEIAAFKQVHGERGVFAFIIGGEPKAEGAVDDCFPAALRRKIRADGTLSDAPAEVVAADARPKADGRSSAFLRLIAGLLGVGFDELRQRELQRRNRRLTIVAAASLAGMAMTLGLAVTAWRARDDAQRRQEQTEDLLTFMLGDLRSELQRVGRLAPLDRIGDKAMAYFAKLNPRDLNDATLTRQAKAFTQIGEIRIAQARYPAAQDAFAAALARASALVERHPQNADMLFERGQAEFANGLVRRTRRDPAAAQWFETYRGTALKLLALEPESLRSQRELMYAHHNLAVLRKDRGEWQPAYEAFAAELASLNALAAAQPDDTGLRYDLADAESWLGTLAERLGRYAEAIGWFAKEIARLEALLKTDPAHADWQFKRATALSFEAGVLTISGDIPRAKLLRAEARSIVEALAKNDPANRTWQRALLRYLVQDAMVARAEGDDQGAYEAVQRARKRFEAIASGEAADASSRSWLATAIRIEIELALDDDVQRRMTAAARAVALMEPLAAAAAPDDGLLAEWARAHVLVGRLASEAGRPDEAQEHWIRACQRLEPRVRDSRDWRILDPLIRAAAFLGRRELAAEAMARLTHLGYQPIDPWPEVLRTMLPSDLPGNKTTTGKNQP